VNWARADDVSKRRRLGLSDLPRDVALRGPLLGAPRCHARAHFRGPCCGPFRRLGCLPVADHPLVGGLGLLGELAPGLAHPLAGGPHAGSRALQRRGAGGDLEQPQLLGGQRRLPVGVVLAAREQAPEQDRELARRGNDGLAVAAAGADPLVEGAQRPGLTDNAACRLDQRPARGRRPPLGDPAAAGRLAARLANPRVKPEIGDQLPRAAKPADVADRGETTPRRSR
jgi:hypothetical protein